MSVAILERPTPCEYWVDGNCTYSVVGGNLITLYSGDCLEVMKEIESGSVDMVMTDPTPHYLSSPSL